MSIKPLNFEHTTVFDREWFGLGLTDSDLAKLQAAIMVAPKAGNVMSGTGGLRKIRFASEESSKGKSGSVRVGYAFYPEFSQILLVVAYGKNHKESLSQTERNGMTKFLKAYETALQVRQNFEKN